MVSDHLPHLLYSTSRKHPFKCRMQARTLYSNALEEHTTVSTVVKQQKTQASKGLLFFSITWRQTVIIDKSLV